jgi:hypothetical protein
MITQREAGRRELRSVPGTQLSGTQKKFNGTQKVLTNLGPDEVPDLTGAKAGTQLSVVQKKFSVAQNILTNFGPRRGAGSHRGLNPYIT